MSAASSVAAPATVSCVPAPTTASAASSVPAPATVSAASPAPAPCTASPVPAPATVFAASPAPPHRVVALLLPGVLALDLAAPAHVFGHCGAPHYTFEISGLRPGPVPTSTGFDVLAPRGLEALRDADTVVVPGMVGHRPPEECLGPLRDAAARGARIMSVCTGAFVLAAAGLLDGRRATTHWDSCADLAARHPAVDVEPGVLYVDEGDVLTSAGVAAGIDLCLHVVRRDHGAELAASIARRTVVAPHRDGGQAQFVRRPIDGGGPGDDARRALAAGLEPTRAWALGRLRDPLDVATLARHANVSPRTFARRFREETGTTPAQWLLDQRTLAAQELLESTDLPVEEVAARSGFGSAASLRQHLARRARTTPTAYRRAFRTTVGDGVAA